jgi:hypothetical protein
MQSAVDQAAVSQPVLEWDMLHQQLEDFIWQGGETRHGEGLLGVICLVWTVQELLQMSRPRSDNANTLPSGSQNFSTTSAIC